MMKGLWTSYRLKWGPFPTNEVGRMAQHIRKGEGRNERKDRESSITDDYTHVRQVI
jgi:hypothetical protein